MIFKARETKKTLYLVKLPGEKVTNRDLIGNGGLQHEIENFLLSMDIMDRDYYKKHRRDKSNRILIRDNKKLKTKYVLCAIKTSQENLRIPSRAQQPSFSDYFREGQITYIIRNINKAEIDYYKDSLENILEKYNISYKIHY